MSDTPATFAFPQHVRLKTPAQFKAVYDRKRSVSDGLLVVYAAANTLPHSRVGLSVSRKVGNAVVRNRWKRLLREAFRLNQHTLPTGLDFILIPRSGQMEPTLDGIVASLTKLAADAARRLGVRPSGSAGGTPASDAGGTPASDAGGTPALPEGRA